MDNIIRRLVENRNRTILSPDIFNIKPHSDESYDLLDQIQSIVGDTVRRYGDDIDLDDNGLDGNSKVGSGDRTIIYKTQIYRYAGHDKLLPIKEKEMSDIEKELSEKIILPEEDEDYEYSVRVDISGTQLSIFLKREEKW